VEVQVQLAEEVVEVEEEVVQLAELVVAWEMEQGSEQLDGSNMEVEQPLEALQLPVLPMQLDNDCLVEVLEVKLPEEEVEVEEVVVEAEEVVVEAEEVVVQLPELVVVVVVVA
jgi:hypothetical protein